MNKNGTLTRKERGQVLLSLPTQTLIKIKCTTFVGLKAYSSGNWQRSIYKYDSDLFWLLQEKPISFLQKWLKKLDSYL